jgi:hypothetical protein
MWNGYGWEAVTITAVGATGATGAGATGATGATGNIGASGATGPIGATGVLGATGSTGADGDRYHTSSATPLTIVSSGNITLTTNDLFLDYSVDQNVVIAYSAGQNMRGSVVSYNEATGSLVVSVTTSSGSGTNLTPWEVNLDGAVGIQGATGSTGPAGATGALGSTGSTGPIGATGEIGATGDIGETGATGPDGATGIGTPGAAGATGATGVGNQGATGATGAIPTNIVTIDTAQTITGVKAFSVDISVNGLTAGKGGGNIASNAAFGASALAANTTGANNIAIGNGALLSNTSANSNCAIGSSALSANTTGTQNIALGINALASNTTGANNVALGSSALLSNIDGTQNTAIGTTALLSNTTGTQNTANGFFALRGNITGIQNTAIGVNALQFNTSGTQNTAVGASSLISNTTFSNIGGLGFNAQVTASNQIQLGDSATTTYAYGAVQDRSDIRDKADVRDTELGLEFVNALRPVDFKWDMREDYRSEMPIAPSEDATEEEKSAYELAKAKWLEDVKLANITHDGTNKRSRFHHGLIAQEVKAVLDAKGIDFGGFQDHSINGGDDVLSIGYVELIAPMLKAIQELSARVEFLESK